MKAVSYIFIAITPSVVRNCNKLWWWCQSAMRGTSYMRLSNYEKNGDDDGDCEMIRPATKNAVVTVKGVADYMHVNVRFSAVDWYS